jgi:hypothetical protein
MSMLLANYQAGWGLINPDAFLCLSQAHVFTKPCVVAIYVQYFEVSVRFVDIVGTVDHHFLNFLFEHDRLYTILDKEIK